VVATTTALLPLAVAAQDIFASRPAFSPADQPARTWASCGAIRSMSAGLPDMDERIDLSVSGEVAAVKTDGALWYIVLCAPPDVRLLCVTYSANELKPGDKAFAKGGYRRVDPNHVLLDPCLASQHAQW
jgi:hypothetical protein